MNQYSCYSITSTIEKNKMKGRKEQKKNTSKSAWFTSETNASRAFCCASFLSRPNMHSRSYTQTNTFTKEQSFTIPKIECYSNNSTILNIKTPMAFYSLIFHSTNSIYKLVYTFNIKTPVDLETIPYYLYSPCNPSSFFFFWYLLKPIIILTLLLPIQHRDLFFQHRPPMYKAQMLQ